MSELAKAIEQALNERWALDSQARRAYFDAGKSAAEGVDLGRFVDLVKGSGTETCIACAIQLADETIPAASVGETQRRALGAVREGLKSALYVRLLGCR